ncbi:SanA/YdcF family protein [Cellulomonas edaphi]|uniref:ElyC/SanA/YdcF family protein n=1 Tax=Cellulomonas edaphi TaxID=3053468 RepID=A0ABT7S2B5_9CELL|nr:ElyC/SanA/YdcF family protein [Cellulomons edaphi]MDM7829756.1 ElyC/SanA/YdcF family protein [Cellulomons edaphi]
MGDDEGAPAPVTADDRPGDGGPTPGPAAGSSALAPAAPRRRRRRRRLVWLAAAAVVLVLLAPLLVVQGVGLAHTRSLGDVPDTPVALVLGAGLRPDGSPSTYLRRRLDAAVSLYERGAVQVVLVSGDNGTTTHDEPGAMRDYLLQAGIRADRIVLDAAGFDTHDSCVRAHEVFGVRSAVVLTQDYHLPRALFSCAAAGMDVTGAPVSASSVQPRQAVAWRLREIPASYKAAWDALVGRAPAAGGHETGVQDALAAAATMGS